MKKRLSRAALTAALVVFLSLILATAGPTPLPDSVRPCMPCHYRAGSDQVGEWLASPYSEKVGGRGCVDCHGGECPDGRDEADLPGLRKAVRLSIMTGCSGGGRC
jgi:hypothetical protein